MFKSKSKVELDKNKEYAIILGANSHEVPFGLNLLVSRDGTDIVNADTGKHYQQYNTRGYKVIYTNINGKSRSYLVHRLVGNAWYPIRENWFRFVINHKDGVKDNNHADNLEWTTKGLNNQHALINKLNDLSRVVKEYKVHDFEINETRTVYTPRHVSAITGLRYELVNTLLGVPIYTTKGRFIFFDPFETPDEIINIVTDDSFMDFRNRCDKNSKNVKAVNVSTGEVSYYSSLKEAANVLNAPISSISQQCNYPSQCHEPINGYIFSEVIDQGAPRKHLKKLGVLEGKNVTNENKRKPIIVTDTETGVSTRYDWFGDFINYVNKKHSKQYVVKHVQRVVLFKRRVGQKPTWKEFEFEFPSH